MTNPRCSSSFRWIERAKSPIAVTTFVAGAFIAISTILMAARAWNPIPFWDQWQNLASAADHSLSSLWAQHNEHRILFPRLIFWLDLRLSKETNVVDFVANFLSQSILLATMSWLAMRVIPGQRFSGPWILGLSSALLFWAVQSENFIWGFQIQFFLVILTAMIVFILITSASQSIYIIIFTLLIEVIAVYSLASGLLVPIIGFTLAVWVRRPRSHLLILAIAAIVLPLTYLIDYHTPSNHSEPAQLLMHFPEVALHFIVQIGAPLMRGVNTDAISASAVVGAAGIGLYFFIFLRIIRNDPSRQEKALIAMACFILGAAALTAAGRVNFGFHQAFASRYATPILVFWLVLIFLFAARFSLAIVMAFSLPITVIASASQMKFVRSAVDESNRRLLAEPALLSDIADPRLSFIFPDSAFLSGMRTRLISAKTSVFAEGWTRWLNTPLSHHVSMSKDASCQSVLFKAIPITAHGWRVDGNASFGPDAKPLKKILITDTDGEIKGYGIGGLSAKLVRVETISGLPENSFWTGVFHADDAVGMKVYALEGDDDRSCLLGEIETLSANVSLSPKPKEIHLGGYVDMLKIEDGQINVHGWAMVTSEKANVFIDTDLDVKSILLDRYERADVVSATKDSRLINSGLHIIINLNGPADRLSNFHLCIWTDDERYGKRVLNSTSWGNYCEIAETQRQNQP
jgi:hypothetical protein